MARKVTNFILFQITWFACILGAANSVPWLGLVAVATAAIVHFAVLSKNRRADLMLLIFAGVYGYVADSVLVVFGLMSFPERAALGYPNTLWMVALWVNFAMTLDLSLAWLRGRLALAALFGAIGGAGSYWAGMRLGAVEFPAGTMMAMLIVAFEWAVAMPVLAVVADRLHASRRSRAANSERDAKRSRKLAEARIC